MIENLKWLLATWLLLVEVNCQKTELSKANNAFAVDLYKKILNDKFGENVFISPVCISTAFGMVSLGARGNTKEQVKAVLHLNQLTSDKAVKEAYKKMFKDFKDQTNDYTLYFANRLFGSDVFKFLLAFLQDLQTYFGSSLESLDCVNKPDESRVHINQWVEEQTNQKITNLLPAGSINTDTKLVVVSAIYFKASWVHPFSKEHTKPGPFRIPKSKSVNMDMMHLYNKVLNYYNSKELHCEVLELPYQERKVSMFIFLPYDVDGLVNVQKKLNVKKFIEILKKVQGHSVNVQLPKFAIEQSKSLKKYLQDLGMKDVFDESKADLSGIGSGQLHITDAIHKAFVNVTESGTEAAAATGVVVGVKSVTSNPIEFIVDRPFTFCILEMNTNTVLFMGSLLRPPKH